MYELTIQDSARTALAGRLAESGVNTYKEVLIHVHRYYST
jgi:hypothetical protein